MLKVYAMRVGKYGTQEELPFHPIRYDKFAISDKLNRHNGFNKKSVKSKYKTTACAKGTSVSNGIIRRMIQAQIYRYLEQLSI